MSIVRGSGMDWQVVPFKYASLEALINYEHFHTDDILSEMTAQESPDDCVIVECSDRIKQSASIVIPNIVDGRRVIAVAGTAFKTIYEDNTTCQTIIVSDGIKYLGGHLFENFFAIQNILLPQSLIYIGEKALACTCESICLPGNVRYIGAYCMEGNWALKECVLENGIPYVGSHMFSGCSNLSTIELPPSIKEIRSYAFTWSGIERILVNRGARVIEEGAFQQCKKLNSIYLPESIQAIGRDAFDAPEEGKKPIHYVHRFSYACCWLGDHDYMYYSMLPTQPPRR